jgi:hypothetical protein
MIDGRKNDSARDISAQIGSWLSRCACAKAALRSGTPPRGLVLSGLLRHYCTFDANVRAIELERFRADALHFAKIIR